jgi:hypothetical protein
MAGTSLPLPCAVLGIDPGSTSHDRRTLPAPVARQPETRNRRGFRAWVAGPVLDHYLLLAVPSDLIELSVQLVHTSLQGGQSVESQRVQPMLLGQIGPERPREHAADESRTPA